MSSAHHRLPDFQIAPLLATYRRDLASRRLSTAIGLLVLLAAVMVSAWVGEVNLPKLFHNIDRFTDYLSRLFYLDNGRHVFTDPLEWFWGIDKWLKLILDTLLMAYLGTLLGAIGAFFICFSASSSLATGPWSLFLVRRFLEVLRGVPTLVFALILVIAFGLGPMPGIMAIALHSWGALGKLFSEIVDNIDMKPVEAIRAAGGSRWQVIRYGVVPQVGPGFTSYGLLRFEINVRESAVMGFVGAGGIGELLIEYIRKFYYSDVSAVLILIILTVMIIDVLTERLRHALQGPVSAT